MVPAIISQAADASRMATGWFWLPGISPIWVMKEVVVTGAPVPGHVIAALASSALGVAVAVPVMVRAFASERLLFRV